MIKLNKEFHGIKVNEVSDFDFGLSDDVVFKCADNTSFNIEESFTPAFVD